jgi:tetratricopeptide (TPR) repeat protein
MSVSVLPFCPESFSAQDGMFAAIHAVIAPGFLWYFRCSKQSPMSDFLKKTLEQAPPTTEDTEKLLLERLRNSTTEDDHFRWLLFVVGYYRGVQRIDAAKGLLQGFLTESDKSEYKVHCHLALGQIATDEQEFEVAVNHFNAAVALQPASQKVQYVLFNNIGYCLNMLARYQDGERQCRLALELDGRRPSAYRNLGISLQGQGNVIGAAWVLVEASKADPADTRARSILEKLISLNPTLIGSHPWIMEGLEASSASSGNALPV